MPDRQLLQAISFQDIGWAVDKDVLADSAIAELDAVIVGDGQSSIEHVVANNQQTSLASFTVF